MEPTEPPWIRHCRICPRPQGGQKNKTKQNKNKNKKRKTTPVTNSPPTKLPITSSWSIQMLDFLDDVLYEINYINNEKNPDWTILYSTNKF